MPLMVEKMRIARSAGLEDNSNRYSEELVAGT